jgi:exopolysaccharide production protein ExoY
LAIHESVNCASPPAGAHELPLGGRTKRAFDVFAGGCALVLLSPLLVLIALLIMVTSGAPVLIRHQRVGRGGRMFACLKFRSMVVKADEVLRDHLSSHPEALEEWTATRKLVDDPRVTRLGRVLRKTSLDELPQLYNIIVGDMSFVGPRPIVDEEIMKYGDAFAVYQLARPGLTGHWQVSGRSDTGYAERVQLDLDYVANWSFGRDMFIILRTIPAVVKARGVY